MEAGDPTGPPKSDPGAACGPFGVEPTTFPPGHNRRPGNLSSPNPTADLVGAYREETTEP